MRTSVACLLAAAFAFSAQASGPLDATGSQLSETSARVSTEDAVYRVDIWDLQPVPIAVSRPTTGSELGAPVFKICNLPESRIPSALRVYTESTGYGPEHPTVETLRLKPGACVFASGALIEAFLQPDALEAAAKARSWVDSRLAALQEEARSLTDPGEIEANEMLIRDLDARAAGMALPLRATLSASIAAN